MFFIIQGNINGVVDLLVASIQLGVSCKPKGN